MVDNVNCIGCGMCSYFCPTKAISLHKNEKGFWDIQIDSQKCIGCNKCDRYCVNQGSAEFLTEPKGCFAAYSTDKSVVQNSSSGGLFSVFAEHMLGQGGVVYGASFDNRLELRHICVEKRADLHLITGSKYLQSRMEPVLSKVEADLKCGKPVLFCGTPCQVAAVKKSFGQYEQLTCIDLLCHGVPSSTVFFDFIKDIEKKEKSKVVAFAFRNKALKHTPYGFRYQLENGKSRVIDGVYSPFGKGFFSGLLLRNACYECRYARKERAGDITLGDFWGGDIEVPDFYNKKGTSCVLINTEKGQELFHLLFNKIRSVEVELEQIKKYNHNLHCPAKRNELYELFWKDYQSKGYHYIRRKYLGNSFRDVLQSIYHRIMWR